MNWKEIKGYLKRIAYILVFGLCWERGWSLWFLLGTMVFFTIWYWKPLYRQMQNMSEMMLMMYDTYIIKKEFEKQFKNNNKKEEVIDITPQKKDH